MSSGHCIIIGAGHAGSTLGFALRRSGWKGPVTLIGNEPNLPYHRPPLSKAFLKGEVELEHIQIRPRALYQNKNIELKLGIGVEHIDRSAQTLQMEDGDILHYDRLVIATGSSHRLPQIPGLDLPGVYLLRTAKDAEAIRARMKKSSRALIVGAGYIGLEVAASLRTAGLAVSILERESRILSRVTSPEIAAYLEQIHLQKGVEIRTEVQITSITKSGKHLCILTRTGEQFTADCIVVGTGAVANTALAESAQLQVDNGILVDEYTQSSDPHIYAIGDCCSQYHPLYQRTLRLESVHNATDQAKICAAALTGDKVPTRSVPWFWSDQYDLKWQIAGICTGYDRVVWRGDPAQPPPCSAWYYQAGRLLSVDAIHDPLAYAVAGKLIASGISPPPTTLADPLTNLKSLL